MQIKVSKTTDPSKAAGAIAMHLRENEDVEITAIGPNAVNQAVKAIIIARGYVTTSGFDFNTVANFVHVDVDDDEKGRSAIQFTVKRAEK